MAAAVRNIYIVDTSSWITVEGHSAQNRILFFLSKLIDSGQVICPAEVWREVKRAPYLKAWLQSAKKPHVRHISDPEYFLIAGRVTYRFPTMAAARADKERGDQWVVAMGAYLKGRPAGTNYLVVSEEGFKRQSIPKACESFDVPHTTLFGMLRNEFPEEGF
jgi:hypothetical protein